MVAKVVLSKADRQNACTQKIGILSNINIKQQRNLGKFTDVPGDCNICSTTRKLTNPNCSVQMHVWKRIQGRNRSIKRLTDYMIRVNCDHEYDTVMCLVGKGEDEVACKKCKTKHRLLCPELYKEFSYAASIVS